jgi:hypothetical protein
MTSKYLTKDQILGAQDIQREEVQVPEWGGMVLVQGLDGAQRDAFEESMIKGKGKNATVNLANLRAKLVARSVVDEDGKRVFDDAEITSLAKKSAAALDRVFTVAQRLSGINQDDVDELTKNSETAPSEDSGSN